MDGKVMDDGEYGCQVMHEETMDEKTMDKGSHEWGGHRQVY